MLQIVKRCLAKIITLIITLILILTLIFVCENAFKQVKINFDVKVEQSLGLMIEQRNYFELFNLNYYEWEGKTQLVK
jgi:hypothetical protein